MNRLAWAEINLSAAQHNLSIARQAAQGSRVMAVIKSDAYGHDALEVANALSDADAFAVARIDEALHLRQQIADKSIIILSGVLTAEDIALCCQHNLIPVIHNVPAVEHLLALPEKTELKYWLKVDTGMHRLGLPRQELPALFEQLKQRPSLECLGIMSHLSDAEDIEHPKNQQQHALLLKLQQATQARQISLCNSAGILLHPHMHGDWVRPGIMLYGANPGVVETALTKQLLPVMTLKTRVLNVKTVNAGDSVGYNETWTADTKTQIATLAIGYGDGYPRHAINGTPVMINNNLYPLAGRVSMDLITVDIGQDAIKVGDTATLWGDGLPVERIAECAKTISYALFTGVTQRVEKRFVR